MENKPQKKVPGYIRGHHSYIFRMVLKGGKKFEWCTYVESQRELDKELVYYTRLVREWGWCEEIERVYATRYDCMTKPEGVRKVA